MKHIACIILNYRDPAAALRAVESVERSTGVSPRIYVVDNASNDGSAEILEHASQGRFQLLVNRMNGGYAAGMNAGLKKAFADGAEYFWLLTQDITVEPGALNTLVELWPRLDHPGMLGSVTDLNGSDKIYYFRSFIEGSRVRHRTKGRSFGEIPELALEFGPTDYVNGACVFTHRAVLEKTGLIPEEYFMYFEDCEWGLKAKRLGFKNYVSYRSRAHHWRETGGFNPGAEYYCRRNAFLFKKRNGFARPWTKTVELAGLTKHYFKARLKSLITGDERAARLAPILREVLRDLNQERFGQRPVP